MKFKEFNDEVFYSGDSIVKITRNDINQLKQFARQSSRCRGRICTHKDIDNSLHEMLIIHEQDIYIRPHKHIGKSESFHIIEGELEIVIFRDDGLILDMIEMSDYTGDKVFYYRLEESLFHTLLVKSPVVVFHETTNGPFRREDMIFAEWSPPENEAGAIRSFLKNMGSQVATFTRG
jgi:cupin fold WbuC family metalloprotein